MKKRVVIAFVIAAAMLGMIFFVLYRNNENSEQTDFVKFAMVFQNAHYLGKDEEVKESVAGEQIGTSTTYWMDPDASEKQKENGANYKAPVFADRENSDYTSVIVLNHKGKYIRAHFICMDNYEDETVTDFSSITDIFQLDQKQAEKIIVNDEREILDREIIDALLKALLVPYPYADYYGDDYSNFTFAFKITVIFQGGDEFYFYIDTNAHRLNAYYMDFQLKLEECRLFEELAGVGEE